MNFDLFLFFSLLFFETWLQGLVLDSSISPFGFQTKKKLFSQTYRGGVGVFAVFVTNKWWDAGANVELHTTMSCGPYQLVI